MFLIAVIDIKRKVGVLLRLLIFLAVIGLVIPKFLSFIAGEITSMRSRSERVEPRALRVQRDSSKSGSESTSANLFEKLQEFYQGKKGSQ
jgi:hypothetical protein